MRRCLLIALASLLIAATPAAAAENSPFPLGQGTRAQALAFGPDGNIWFTANKYGYGGFTNVIGRLTPEGEVREYSLPSRDQVAIGGIVAGADGSLWFADTAEDAIGRSDLSGQVTEFPLEQGSAPTGIAVAPDGSIWFAATGRDRLGRIDGGGSITTVPLPAGARPSALAVADGAFWVTENGRNSIARVAPDGVVSEFLLPHPESKPKAIVRGADGNLWFSEEGASRIGRITPAGEITEFEVPGNAGGTGALAAAPDGTIFFATGRRHAWVEIGSLSPAGRLTGPSCPLPTTCTVPVGALAVGPEGRLWYATGIRYTEGGGANAQIELYAGGLIGRYASLQPLALSIPRQAPRLHGRYVRIALACKGSAGAWCAGTLALEGKIRRRGAGRPVKVSYGRRSFQLRAGTSHRFALKIGPLAVSILRNHPLRLTARATVRGGPQASRQLTLRSPSRR
jgi:virginiamycin B lyase